MNKRIILPNTKISNLEAPLIFLAGPIRGAGNWQNSAIEILQSLNQDVYIASPNLQIQPTNLKNQAKSNELSFPRQLDWERYYLKKASETGTIMFWLPTQVEAMPLSERSGFPKVYARDTRPETAGWGWKLLETNPNARIILGGEEGFDGYDVIKRNFLKIKPDTIFYSTLEQTCQEAIKLAKQKTC
jgi:hypothetical protein